MTACQRVLVVGAGLGGLRVAESLRSNGFAGDLVVAGDEPWAPYNRPPLSKEALAGGVAHEQLAFRQRSSAADVEWRLGDPAVSVDLADRTAELERSGTLEWDALVVATGVAARRLPVAGPVPSPASGRHVVRTLDDASGLRPELLPGRRIVILGAGFIGCEVASTAVAHGCTVTCVALDPEPMVRPLGTVLGAELRRRHEEHGVEFRLGTGVAALHGDPRVSAVELADGSAVDCDLVVEALGSVPSTGLLDGQGLDLDDGVLADGALRPLRGGQPLDGVAVVGDVARIPNPRFGDGAWRVEHWSIPTDTGRRAGAVLAAHLAGTGYDDLVQAPWSFLPAFWSDQYDIRLQSYGMPGLADPDGIRILEGDLSDEVVVGYHRGEELVGVVGLGMLKQVNAYRDRVGSPPS